MSTTDTTSASESGSESDTPSQIHHSYTQVASGREQAPPASSRSHLERSHVHGAPLHRTGSNSSSSQLPQATVQGSEQTIHEFLRSDVESSWQRHGPGGSTPHQNQVSAAMERKRRLTGSRQDDGRRRYNGGNGFHEREARYGRTSSLDGPSSPRTRGETGPSINRTTSSEVIDLTGSSPVTSNEALPQQPPPQQPPLERRPRHRPSRTSSRSSRAYTVPNWQPDSDVNECPVCGRTFSFLFRRHHCRKCGRVVCSDCSPHRITLPRSMIVYQPGTEFGSSAPGMASGRPAVTVDLTGDDTDDNDNRSRPSLRIQSSRSELEGGLKVRLCNPCVPDPQPSPRDETDAATTSQSPRRPSPGSRLPHFPIPAQNAQGVPVNMPFQQAYPSNRSIPHPGGQRSSLHPSASAAFARAVEASPRTQGPALGQASSYDDPFSRLRRLMGVSSVRVSGSLKTNLDQVDYSPPGHPQPQIPTHGRFQSLDSLNRYYPPPPPQRPRIRSMLDADPNLHPLISPSIDSSNSPHHQRPHVPPRPRLRESDICPVCRRPLPPKGPSGDETAREAHIMSCIAARDPTSSSFRARASSSTNHNLPPGFPVPTSSSAPDASHSHMPPSPSERALHFISFTATEKDCLGEDGNLQECSICMVEYDVGDTLARLECLCKFHRECIVSWLERKQECPLHKIA